MREYLEELKLKHPSLSSDVGFFSYNSFTGDVAEEICALRDPNGNLGMLQVDCSRENGKVDCTCCTSCRQPDEDGERKLIMN